MNQIQQGDVMLEEVTGLPEGAVPKNGGLVMAGELTGHAHRLDTATKGLLYEKDGVLFIKTAHSVILRHEEHGPLTITPGTWKVGRVHEYDYTQQMTRPVLD